MSLLRSGRATATALLLLAGLSCSAPAIETVKPERRNPSEFDFPRTAAEVEAAIAAEFADLSYRGMRLALLPGRGARLYTKRAPISLSPVYRMQGRELPYLAEFYLEIEPLPGGGTRVFVIADRTEVIAGSTSGFLESGAPAPVYVEVEPTGIEEYEILQRLGVRLGVRLPPAVTPPAREFDALAAGD